MGRSLSLWPTEKDNFEHLRTGASWGGYLSHKRCISLVFFWGARAPIRAQPISHALFLKVYYMLIRGCMPEPCQAVACVAVLVRGRAVSALHSIGALATYILYFLLSQYFLEVRRP